MAVLFWCICLCVTSCEVEFAIAEMACVSRNIRTAVPAAYGIPVQRSISGRDVSHPRVELGLTGLTSTSQSSRTTCSKSLALLRSSVSVLSVRPRILFVVEFDLAEMACVSSNVRRTFHVPSGVRVQRSISGRDVSHPELNSGSQD